MLQSPKELDILDKRELDCPTQAAWLGCLAVQASWVRDAEKRSGRRESPQNQQIK